MAARELVSSAAQHREWTITRLTAPQATTTSATSTATLHPIRTDDSCYTASTTCTRSAGAAYTRSRGETTTTVHLQRTSVDESDGQAGVVEWEGRSVDDRMRQVNLLHCRSRDERGGAISDTQPEHESITAPSGDKDQLNQPHSHTPPSSSNNDAAAHTQRTVTNEIERSHATAEEWKAGPNVGAGAVERCVGGVGQSGCAVS